MNAGVLLKCTSVFVLSLVFVRLVSAERLIPPVEKRESTCVQLCIGEILLHPQRQLSGSCRALTADPLTTETLRRSPRGWAPKRHTVLYSERALTAVSTRLGHGWFTRNYRFLILTFAGLVETKITKIFSLGIQEFWQPWEVHILQWWVFY